MRKTGWHDWKTLTVKLQCPQVRLAADCHSSLLCAAGVKTETDVQKSMRPPFPGALPCCAPELFEEQGCVGVGFKSLNGSERRVEHAPARGAGSQWSASTVKVAERKVLEPSWLV